MVREIISIQVGACGNRVGTKFWEVASDEHGIGPTGLCLGNSDCELGGIDVYYNEAQNGRFVPRAVLVDLEPSTLDSVRGGLLGSLFRPENFIFGHEGSGNNWGRGFGAPGHELSGFVLDQVRREVERCDQVQGFQLIHSLCGGTGSGLGSLLLNALTAEYSDSIVSSYSLFPSPSSSDNAVEVYNTVLSIPALRNSSSAVFTLDNDALYRLSSRLTAPTYGDLNHLISMLMLGITCSLRFPGQINADLRKLLVNLVPFPFFRFFICGLAPLVSRGRTSDQPMRVSDLIRMVLGDKNMMSSVNPRYGMYMSATAQFRGRLSPPEVEEALANFQSRNTSYFVEWVPDNIMTSVCDVPPRGLNMSATFIGNTTAMRLLLTKIDDNYVRMRARSAWIHQYIVEGVDMEQFDGARSDLCDLIHELGDMEYLGGRYMEDSEEDSYDDADDADDANDSESESEDSPDDTA